MKYLKMLGLAAIAAMALMAIVGAGSASATVLCKKAPTGGVCPTGETYPAKTAIESSISGSATLESTGGVFEDTCTESTVKGEVKNAGGKGVSVSGPVSTLTFSSCANTTKVLNQTGELKVTYTSGSNGTLVASGFEVTVEAISGVSCVYSAGTGTTLGTATGGSPATLDLNAVVNKKSGSFLCPADSVWKGTYTATAPSPLFIAEE